jgi:cellulase
MANCNGPCQGVAGSSLDWFKVYEANYDPATGKWPTDSINEANGYSYSFKLPTDLPGGNYLVRHELLALHLLENDKPSPQFYPIAFALELNSDGTTVPTPTGKFPDMYARDNMAVTHNIYVDDNAKFVVPGVRL